MIMTAIFTIFMGSNVLEQKLEKEEISQGLTHSKWQNWAWKLQPMALLLVFLPHSIPEDDWQQDWGDGSSGKSP